MRAPDTRVDTALLRADVTAATAALVAIEAGPGARLVSLADADRKTMPRVRTGFPAAARSLAALLASRPEIAAVVGYDADQVVEDLDNVEAIDALIPRVEQLLQALHDSKLQWLAEAQEPTLAAYAVATTQARRDGSLAALVAPLADVLSNTRRPAK